MNKNESNWVIAVGIVLVILLFGGFGFGMMGGYSGYGMMGSYWTGGFGFGWIFMILIWILVIIALVLGIMWLVRQLQQPQKRR